ncbi:MAG TPA: hypothetical protein VMH39_13850, partial [Gemmatimonadaceae bacterium]|nr:hypothetical protein [Gemmatimonadaceae bacterium]
MNDASRRRVELLDSTLAPLRVVMDTSPSSVRHYPRASGPTLPFARDSTAVLDLDALAFLVFDPDGRFSRVQHLPRPEDSEILSGFRSAIDATPSLLYLVPPPPWPLPPSAVPAGADGAPSLPPAHDSAPLIRAGFSNRRVDTVTFLEIAKRYPNSAASDSDGHRWMVPTINPLPIADDWVLMDDGSVAVVRARDFHIDWIAPGGTCVATPRMPYQWHRLTDSEKVALLDSVRQVNAAHPAGAVTLTGPHGSVIRRAMVAAVPGPSELPDYASPFVAGSARVDADGNLWLQERLSEAGDFAPVFDLVNRKGELFDRV